VVFALIFLLQAFWVTVEPSQQAASAWILARPIWNVRLSRWALLVIAVGALVIFFRTYRLGQVPPEMVSDHAEKLLDIWDVLHGETRIFFPRNTGREAFQMYLTAGVIQLFGTGYSFLSMKIGTAIAGLITLVYVYLVGKEVGNRRVALLTLLLVGIAYWPNVITRFALRFSLYPLFVAPTLYYLLRGIRRSNRNDYILAGIALGLGLHGYTPFRIMPLVVVTAVGLYLIHRQSKGSRKQTLWGTVLLILFALVIFLPLLRFWVRIEAFSYRALTGWEPLNGPCQDRWLDISTELMECNGDVCLEQWEIWPASILIVLHWILYLERCFISAWFYCS
jgi:4-amino-4-deoxy-L-arabinose transferase-like glycosyltransferase